MSSEDVKEANEAETPEAETETAEADTEAVDAASAEAEADDETEADDASEDDGGDGDDDEGEPKPRARKRPGRLERKLARQEAEISELRRLVAQGGQAEKPDEPAKPKAKPQIADFDTDEAYFEALVDWAADQKIANVQAEATRRRNESARQRQQRETQEKQSAWLTEGEKLVEGFAEIIADPDVAMTPAMADALVQAENGHAAALHLADNPDEAARIAGLTTTGQAMAIQRLAMKSKTPGKKRSKAPPPPKTLQGSSKGTSDPSKMTAEEYYEFRNKQLKAAS